MIKEILNSPDENVRILYFQAAQSIQSREYGVIKFLIGSR